MGIKYSVREDFFKSWSRNSAYVLGFLFADGNLEDAPYIRGKYIRITSCDYSIIDKIRQVLESAHKVVVIPSCGARKEKYMFRIGNSVIYNDLRVRGLHPRKSHNMEFPSVPGKFLSDFIRGYFDGDGTVAIETAESKRYGRLKVIFTSGSKSFLLSLEQALNGTCVGRRMKIYNSHRSYQLVYRSLDALKILNFIYRTVTDNEGLCLERKYNKYQELVSTPNKYKCENLFDKSSRISTYRSMWRRTQVV
ncbi:MAG: LAGLIDADG family homing endonuclease [Candidatus Omnitrophota bacterium]|nr:hypothetical protein [Candidatus Omnitrophota bacterium]